MWEFHIRNPKNPHFLVFPHQLLPLRTPTHTKVKEKKKKKKERKNKRQTKKSNLSYLYSHDQTPGGQPRKEKSILGSFIHIYLVISHQGF